MKRLGVLISILVILFSVTTVLTTPEKVFAQTTPPPLTPQQIERLSTSQGTHEYFYTKGVYEFQQVLVKLEALRSTYESARAANPTLYTSRMKGLNENLDAVNRSYQAYVSTYNSSRGSNPPTAQTLALSSASTVLTSFNPSVEGRAADFRIVKGQAGNLSGSLVQTLADLTTEARQVQSGVITAGSAESGVLGNATTEATRATTPDPVSSGKACTISFLSDKGFSLLGCIDEVITWFIKTILLNIAGFFLWLSANMLNTSIQVSILNFKDWAPDTLYPIWITIRQIISLCVVFAGLWLGFMYIIDRGDKFEKYIPWVILFALFVNFSYPIARTLVDVSNVISLNIYTSAVGADSLAASSGSLSSTSNAGSLIMSRLGLQDLVVSATGAASTGNMLGQINSMPGALLAVAFVFYAAFVFFMATALIIIRTAVLVFLIIASPLLLVDSVIPKLGDAAAKLRKMFFEQLIVAPVFMLMLGLTLKFLEVFRTGSGPLSSSGGESVKVFFNILMMLIMLHIMLKVTKSVSGSAGEIATNAIGKVGGFGLGVATGGAGFLARGTIGRAAAVARDSKWVTNNQDGMLGRGVYGLTNSLAKSSYDARNVGTISSTMGKAGIPLGKGVATNYEKNLADRAADRTERFGRIKTLNKDGTINKEGVDALSRFKQNQGGLSNTLLGNASSFVFNKKEVGEKLTEADTKMFAAKTPKQKAEYLTYLQSQVTPIEKELATLAQSDPALQSVKARGLQQKMKPLADEIRGIQQKYGSDIRAYEDGIIQTITKYSQSDAKDRVTMRINAEKDERIKQLMISVDKYLSTDGTTDADLDKKVESLLELKDSDAAAAVIKNSSFGKLQDTQKKEIENDEAALNEMKRVGSSKEEYDNARVALEKKKRQQRELIESLRKTLEQKYREKASGQEIAPATLKDTTAAQETEPLDINLGENTDWKVTREQLQQDPNAARIPAFERKKTATPNSQNPGDAASSVDSTSPQNSPSPSNNQASVNIAGENTDERQPAEGAVGAQAVAPTTNPGTIPQVTRDPNFVAPANQNSANAPIPSTSVLNPNTESAAERFKRRKASAKAVVA